MAYAIGRNTGNAVYDYSDRRCVVSAFPGCKDLATGVVRTSLTSAVIVASWSELRLQMPHRSLCRATNIDGLSKLARPE